MSDEKNKNKKYKVVSFKLTEEELQKLNTSTPLTKLKLVQLFNTTITDYDKWRIENDGTEIIKMLDQIILNSFYEWGMNPKIKSGRAIDLYVENEIPKSTSGIKLEIINDINEIEKMLQPFDINNNRVDIENPRDDVTIIGDDLSDLVEEIEESEDA